MSILSEICDHKRAEIAKKKKTMTLADLEAQLPQNSPEFSFSARLNEHRDSRQPAIIAEIKKASPSAGLIRPNFDHVRIAQSYFDGGAACLSVLTDQRYFKGEDSFIADIKKTVALPVLRKDFIIDRYQIIESRVLGADCILLILSVLEPDEVRDFSQLAEDLGMDVLFETHNLQEIETASKFNPVLMGVNSRNLKTQTTDLDIFEKLFNALPDSSFKIAESGIREAEDIKKLKKTGYEGFLIGEYLMRQKDPGEALRKIKV